MALTAGGGCSSGPPRIEIAGQDARLSTAMVGVCSVFMRIANPGEGGDALVGVRVDVPGSTAEIHEVRDGKMMRAARIAIPAGGSLELRPGGAHVMVFGLPEDMGAGRQLTLRLEFERSGVKSMPVTLR
jgi:copper(I)-binding protein